MKQKNLKFFAVIVLLSSAVLFNACSDEPGSIGDELLSSQNVILYDTLLNYANCTIYDSTYNSTLNLGSSTDIMVGKCKNITAKSLLKFKPNYSDRSTEITNGTAVLDSAVIYLTREYKYGDTTQTFSMGAYELSSAWTSFGFTKDSLASLSVGSEAAYEYRYITSNDTMYVAIPLKKSVVYNWMKAAVDTNYSIKNQGIILQPKAGCNLIYGFQAVSSLLDGAVLKVYLQKSDLSGNTETSFPVQEDVHVASLNDTTTIHFKDAITVQNSVILAGLIKIDISALPKDAVLNSCQLILKKHRDTLSTIYSYTGTPNYGSSINAGYVEDTVNLTITTGLTSQFNVSNDVYTANITNIISKFYNEKKNIILSIYSGYQSMGADVITFYNRFAANPDDRPKLKIVYSRKGQ